MCITNAYLANHLKQVKKRKSGLDVKGLSGSGLNEVREHKERPLTSHHSQIIKKGEQDEGLFPLPSGER